MEFRLGVDLCAHPKFGHPAIIPSGYNFEHVEVSNKYDG